MSFLISPGDFDSIHLHFGPTVKNNDSDGNFSRIIYSTKHISFNGLGIMVDLADVQHESHYKKTFMRFDPHAPENSTTMTRLQTIENEILDKYVIKGSLRCSVHHSLSEQLNVGCIKAYTNDGAGAGTGAGAGAANSDDHADCSHGHGHGHASKLQVMLKICGVWETKGECGILYKFIKC
jgi:hypothetical protein